MSRGRDSITLGGVFALGAVIALGANGFAQELEYRPGTRFGIAVAALGDIDGDCVEDFAVGAPYATRAGRGAGCVLVYSGASLRVLRRLDSPTGDEPFGSRLARWRGVDLDGDGVDELAVGCDGGRRTALLSPATGKFLRYFDAEFGQVQPAGEFDGAGGWGAYVQRAEHLTLQSLASSHVWPATRLAAGESLVGHVGDLDGDGTFDVVTRTGNRAACLRLGSHPDEAIPFALPAGSTTRMAWWYLADPGDLDHDGRGDFLVAAACSPRESYGGLGVFSGTDARPLRTLRPLAGHLGFRAGLNGNGGTGYGLAALGDVDGDASGDYAVGVCSGSSVSAITMISGATGAPVWEREWALEFDGPMVHEGVGTALDRLADRDGDGVDELLVGGTDFLWSGDIQPYGTVRILSGATGRRLWIAFEYRESALRDE